jgi:hypothetical protein
MTPALWFCAGALCVLLGVWARRHWASFSAQRPDDYADADISFDIRHHLAGDILCEGVIYGPFGRVTSRFVAQMHGNWRGDTGTMTEQFRYHTGSIQNRIWTLSVDPTGQITATAPDIMGEGLGQQTGAGVRLTYRIKLPGDAGGHILDVTDWMYLMDNGTIINRSQFRKFGIKVAELVATMRKDQTQNMERETAE